MKRNEKRKRRDDKVPSQKRKVSEMVHEFAGDFIRLGEILEQRQYRLNADWRFAGPADSPGPYPGGQGRKSPSTGSPNAPQMNRLPKVKKNKLGKD